MPPMHAVLTPPNAPQAPDRLQYVHIFHIVRSKFGVLASSHGEAIAAAMPLFGAVDFSCRQADGTTGYLETAPTDQIASLLVDDAPDVAADQAAFAAVPSEPRPEDHQLLHLATALHRIASEDKDGGRFAQIARDALAASGISIVERTSP